MTTLPSTPVVRRGYVRGPGWQRVTRGVHRLAVAEPDLLGDLACWQLALPHSSVFTGITAAMARGWWLPALPPAVPVFVGLPREAPRPRRMGLVVRRQARPVAHELLGGLRVAPASDVLLAAARDFELLDLIVLIDAALHLGQCDLASLAAAAAHATAGSRGLRRALRFADGRSESAWETVLRVLAVTCNVPVEPQYEVRDADGLFLARSDLRVEGTRCLLEYDGRGHRTAQQHAKDLRRERGLLRAGWQRYGYTADVVLHNARAVLLDADLALGREHRPERIRAWHLLLAESTFTAAGLARLAVRWQV